MPRKSDKLKSPNWHFPQLALPPTSTSPNWHFPKLALPPTGLRPRLKSPNCRYTIRYVPPTHFIFLELFDPIFDFTEFSKKGLLIINNLNKIISHCPWFIGRKYYWRTCDFAWIIFTILRIEKICIYGNFRNLKFSCNLQTFCYENYFFSQVEEMWLHLTLSMKVSYSQPLLPKFKFQINPVKQFWIFFLTEKEIYHKSTLIIFNNLHRYLISFKFSDWKFSNTLLSPATPGPNKVLERLFSIILIKLEQFEIGS